MGVVGTIIGGAVLVFIFYLVFSSIYFTIASLGIHSSTQDSGPFATETGTGIAATITTTIDNMSLVQLKMLSFENSTTCGGLADRQFWDTALKTSGDATVHLIENTVYSLTQSTDQWTTFFRENMTDPPSWLSLGLGKYTSDFEANLAARVMGTDDLTLAAAVMKNYTSYAGGLSLAGLDFVSFGGLSGLKTYVGTGNSTQGAEATFPGQIYELYSLSQDCSYPKEQRAQFFGEALALTSLVVVTSGKDGFGPKFEALLLKVKLLDAWPKIKAYFQDIGGVSPAAAYETTLVLEELAKKFPSTFGEVAPFTSDRIAFVIDGIETVRGEENAMLHHGSPYTVGRIGAEIAYVIADKKLGLKDIILQEPSVGGRDLYTRDNTVAIQARALANPDPSDFQTTIQKELVSLVNKLGHDYANQKDMKDGYAILSYVDPTDGALKCIIVEVPRP